MANNIFDDISMEELNEMLNNLPNDFDSEKKIEKRIQKKTMHRINVFETSSKRNEALRAITTIAAVCVMVIAVMWAVGFDNVSAYVKKTFFTPGMDSTAADDGSGIWVETTPSEVIVHKKEEYVPLVLKESVTVSNENGSLTLVNVTSSYKVRMEKSPEEYEDIEQYYIDQGGKYYPGVTINLQIEFEDDVLTQLKKTYKDDLYEGYPTFEHESEAYKAIGDFGGYNFTITANGDEYTDIGINTNYNHAYGSSVGLDEAADYHVGFDGWTFVIDEADLKAGQTYTLTLDHEWLGKLSLDFVLEAADELGVSGSHETLTVTHNGITVSAIKYDTEINGNKYVAVDTSIDDSAFPYDAAGGGAGLSSYTDENMNEVWVGFEKSDGSLIKPVDWNDGTFYFDAEKIDDGDDFVVPGIGLSDMVHIQEISLPIPQDSSEISDDVIFEFALGNLTVDNTRISEDFSVRDTVIEGKGLLMDMKWESAEGLEGLILYNVFGQRPAPEGVGAYYNQTGIDTLVTTGYLFNENEPYFIKILDTDKDKIELEGLSISAFIKEEYRFNF